MSRVTATSEDPAKAGPEDWRPTSTVNAEAKERAAFLASWGEPEKPAARAAEAEPDDGDDDLDDEPSADEDDVDEEPVVVAKPAPKAKAKLVAPVEPEPDDDSDLDEHEDEDKPADPVVAKGFAKLQKQEQRMRAQLAEKEARWQAEVAKQREEVQAERTAAAEARAELARIKAKVKTDPAGALEDLGADDFDYAAKMAYVRSKDGGNPANKEAAARLQAEREMKAKLSDVEKKLADREKAETDSRKEAELRGQVETYLGSVVKSAGTVKTATLTQKMLAADPDYALSRIKAAAGQLYRGGEFPTARAVIVEVEKAERAMLRRYGINPKTLAPAPTDTTKAAPGAKPANRKGAKPADDEDLKLPSREELLAEDWTR